MYEQFLEGLIPLISHCKVLLVCLVNQVNALLPHPAHLLVDRHVFDFAVHQNVAFLLLLHFEVQGHYLIRKVQSHTRNLLLLLFLIPLKLIVKRIQFACNVIQLVYVVFGLFLNQCCHCLKTQLLFFEWLEFVLAHELALQLNPQFSELIIENGINIHAQRLLAVLCYLVGVRQRLTRVCKITRFVDVFFDFDVNKVVWSGHAIL